MSFITCQEGGEQMEQEQPSQAGPEKPAASGGAGEAVEVGKRKRRWPLPIIVVIVVLALVVVVYLVPQPVQYTLTKTGEDRFELKGPAMTFTNVAIEDDRMVIRMGNLGEKPGSPFAYGMWVAEIEAESDIVLNSDLTLGWERCHRGDRLTIDKEQNLFRQRWSERLRHAAQHFAWRMKHPFKA
jgi:hypothetical protein